MQPDSPRPWAGPNGGSQAHRTEDADYAPNKWPLPPGSPMDTLWGPSQPPVCAPSLTQTSKIRHHQVEVKGQRTWSWDKAGGQVAGSEDKGQGMLGL